MRRNRKSIAAVVAALIAAGTALGATVSGGHARSSAPRVAPATASSRLFAHVAWGRQAYAVSLPAGLVGIPSNGVRAQSYEVALPGGIVGVWR
jgi:hypothetical protein